MTKRLKEFIDNPYSSAPNFEHALQAHPTATKFIVVAKNEDVCDFIPYHLRRLVPQNAQLGVIEKPSAADLAETHINTCLADKAEAMYPQVEPRIRLNDSVKAITELKITDFTLADVKTLRQMANNISDSEMKKTLKSQIYRFTDRYEKHILDTLQKVIKQEPTIDDSISLAFGDHSKILPTLNGKYIDEKTLFAWLNLNTSNLDTLSATDADQTIARLAWLEEQIKTAISTVCTVHASTYNIYYRRMYDKLLQDVRRAPRTSGVYDTIDHRALKQLLNRFDTPPVVFATTRGGKGSDCV